jgi:hypothetical protein
MKGEMIIKKTINIRKESALIFIKALKSYNWKIINYKIIKEGVV